jgi:flagellar motility protein MotE (MotC chaperone)
VSWGELIDRITILEIKSERLRAEDALANVRNELVLLRSIADPFFARQRVLAQTKAHLRAVNERLWDAENRLREKEQAEDFGAEFIQIARSVYTNNDERAALKRQINDALPCGIAEEKSYSSLSLPSAS